MKIKAMMLTVCFLLGMGRIFTAPQQVNAEVIDSDVNVLFVNESKSFATVVVEEVSTNIQIELRLEETHPNKKAIMAILLTAVSLDEVIRIRWEEGDPPILLRAAINRL